MTTYSKGRYLSTGECGPRFVICQDTNLDRQVCIRWVASVSKREEVRIRLATLQSVRSPYIALIYDIVEEKDQVGVVEEDLRSTVEVTEADRLERLHELCAGLVALHASDLAHGALKADSFRVGPLGKGRLCNLAFCLNGLNIPSTDNKNLAALLTDMGADRVTDAPLQQLRAQLASLNRAPVRSVQAIRDRLAALLLRDRHRALAYWSGTSVELSAQRRSARFAHPSAGVASVALQYDGTRFFPSNVIGEVFVNNIPLSQGDELPSSCVIALGASHRPRHDRYFVTFDQSHPEVI